MTGKLNVKGGKMRVAAKRVIPLWPDEEVDYMSVTSTTLNTKTGVTLNSYDNLFYVYLTQDSSSSTANGSGSLYNYGG